jgi:hypothetical protein
LIAIKVIVTREVSIAGRPPKTVRGVRTVFAPSATQDGHWNPTDADRMQSGQIGRSQRVHRT